MTNTDYLSDVLEKYLNAFAEVDYQLVCSQGHTGTCSGLPQALSFIPEHERFMLIWCDLILPEDYALPDTDGNVIGISKDFPCRWKYENGVFEEERSAEHGVAGHFIFHDRSCIRNVPEDGEFVRWLRDRDIRFEEQPLYHTREYGLYSEWDRLPKTRCRPFNRLEMTEDTVTKVPLDEQGRTLAAREIQWYKKVNGGGVSSQNIFL